MTNEELVRRYPWLLPRKYDDEPIEDFDYSYTLLDEMPIGWRTAFGEEMQEELLKALEETNSVSFYRVDQIKEKFGELRWYDHGGNEQSDDIVDKYTTLSANICICCGKPDVPYCTDGWCIPICGDCFAKDHPSLNQDALHEAYLRATERSYFLMDEHPTIEKYEDGQSRAKTLDYSETANGIRTKWEERKIDAEIQ